MKRGDFSDYRNVATGAVVPIYDPWTQCGINNPGSGRYNGDCGTVPNRLQFPGNIIPDNRISPIARRYLDFPVYDKPTVPGRWQTENWEKNASVGGDNDQMSFRGDYNLSQNQRLIGRYTRFESTNLPVDLYGNGQRQGDPIHRSTSSRRRRWSPTRTRSTRARCSTSVSGSCAGITTGFRATSAST